VATRLYLNDRATAAQRCGIARAARRSHPRVALIELVGVPAPASSTDPATPRLRAVGTCIRSRSGVGRANEMAARIGQRSAAQMLINAAGKSHLSVKRCVTSVKSAQNDRNGNAIPITFGGHATSFAILLRQLSV
jgi:hypothetical protein